MKRDNIRSDVEWQSIRLNPIDAGLVLDVGGGSEGLVSRIAGDRVCAVDIKFSKVVEARIYEPGSNWFVSDAQYLPFGDNLFDMATFWFSLMFMREDSIKKRAFQEAFRVLQEGGLLHIMASTIDRNEDPFFFRAVFTLPDETLSKIGYGVRGGQEQTLEHIAKLVSDVGFDIDSTRNHGSWFIIKAKHPVQ